MILLDVDRSVRLMTVVPCTTIINRPDQNISEHFIQTRTSFRGSVIPNISSRPAQAIAKIDNTRKPRRTGTPP